MFRDKVLAAFIAIILFSAVLPMAAVFFKSDVKANVKYNAPDHRK
jgi:hypothetical protein